MLRDKSHNKEAAAPGRDPEDYAPLEALKLRLTERIYLARQQKIADNKREASSRKIVKCRVLVAHPLVTVRGCRRRSSAPGLPTCAFSCG